MTAIPLLAAPAAPPTDPLDADVVDASSFPTVLIDFVVPPPLRSLTITLDMVEFGGASVVSVAPVDPAGIVVGLVIDDGPTVAPDVVEEAQGASVELVRNVGDGTKIALSTPSGLQSALTSDRSANIARIAGITAGAPDVMPLSALVLDAAARLAESTETDRHLVVVLGSSPTVDLDVLTDLVTAGDISVHVIAPDGLELGGLAELAASTGGVVPSIPAMVGEIDVATAAIAQRYRVEASVDSAGPRELAVVVDETRHSATVDVVAPQPAAVPSSSVVEQPTTTIAAAVPPPVTAAAPSTVATPATAPPATTASSSGGGSAGTAQLLGVIAAVIAGAGLVLFLRRRADDDEAAAETVTAPPPAPSVVSEPPVEPAAEPEPEPEPLAEAPPGPEPEPAPARSARVAAAPRPRRSSTPRRGEAKPAVEPEPAPAPAPVPAVEPDVVESDAEWIVSGDLRLRRSTGQVWSGHREVSLTPAELGVLELLMRSGERGVTPDAIAEAAGRGVGDNGEPVDPDAVLTQLRRKTRLPGKTRRVRKERVMLYFFGDDDLRG